MSGVEYAFLSKSRAYRSVTTFVTGILDNRIGPLHTEAYIKCNGKIPPNIAFYDGQALERIRRDYLNEASPYTFSRYTDSVARQKECRRELSRIKRKYRSVMVEELKRQGFE